MLKHLPIPPAAMESHIAVLGMTGSGKTYAAKGAVEGLLNQGERVCIIDPTGVWHGLRVGGRGCVTGFDIPVIGGRHGDVPIRPEMAEALAKVVGHSAVSMVIDTQTMSTAKRISFFTVFAETLLAENRGPLHLVIDEAHLFAPQGRTDFQAGAMVHATNNLVSLGRSAGIRVMMITQRPAKLSKDSLTQASAIVAMRVISPQDRSAIKEWLGGYANKTIVDEMLSELTSMPVGQGIVWAPTIGYLERHSFPSIMTFDSGAPNNSVASVPTLNQSVRDALLSRLATVAVEDDGDDYAHGSPVRARKKNLSTFPEKINTVDVAAIRAEGFAEGFAAGRAEMAKLWSGALQDLQRRMEESVTILHGTSGETAATTHTVEVAGLVSYDQALRDAAYRKPDGPIDTRTFADMERETGAQPDSTPTPQRQPKALAPGEFPAAAQKLLAAIDFDPPIFVTWGDAALLAGVKGHGGSFNGARKALRESGKVKVDGNLIAIAEPTDFAEVRMPTPAEMIALWEKSLKPAAGRVIRALFDLGGRATGPAIAYRLSIAPHGGSWNGIQKELRTAGIVDRVGTDFVLTRLFSPTSS